MRTEPRLRISASATNVDIWMDGWMDAHLLVEEEVGGDGELHPQQRPGDRLHASRQLHAGELVHQAVQRLAHPRQLHQLSEVGRLEVVVPARTEREL